MCQTLSRYSTCLCWKRLVAEPGRSLGHLSEHRREQRLGEGGVHGKVHLLMTLGFDQGCAFVKMKLSFLEVITVVWWADTSLIYGHSSAAGTNFAHAECICKEESFLWLFPLCIPHLVCIECLVKPVGNLPVTLMGAQTLESLCFWLFPLFCLANKNYTNASLRKIFFLAVIRYISPESYFCCIAIAFWSLTAQSWLSPSWN